MVITDAIAEIDRSVTRATIVPVGEIDAGSVQELADLVSRALRRGVTELDVDLGSVAFMDTTALRVLEAAAEHLRGRGHLSLRNAQPPVARLLQIAALVHAPLAS